MDLKSKNEVNLEEEDKQMWQNRIRTEMVIMRMM
jgi:hypothetical protein